MADTSALTNFVTFLAGLGGFGFLAIIGGIVVYLIVVLKLPLITICFPLLILGLFMSIACTSVSLATMDPEVQKAVIITQAVINCICIILLGFTSYLYTSGSLTDRTYYIWLAMPVALLLSITSASAAIMNRISSAAAKPSK
jgi:hypothetical protein